MANNTTTCTTREVLASATAAQAMFTAPWFAADHAELAHRDSCATCRTAYELTIAPAATDGWNDRRTVFAFA